LQHCIDYDINGIVRKVTFRYGSGACPVYRVFKTPNDRFSLAYDFVCRPLLESGRKKAVEILRLRSGEKILEIGIGTGLSLDFPPEGINLTAFDYSVGMLKESRKKLDECRRWLLPTTLSTVLLQHMF